jgi:O-antigen chain-terminating methyltransferase
MLQACREVGLKVELGDAFEYLAKMPNESQTVITAFHFVEHISFELLQTLVKESLRVLKPGGLLILETPNPENIVVATRNFYLDPTHQKPIPPDLLSFVVEHAGFAVVKTLRLQEKKDILHKNNINMQDVFAGVSPDYAVVAQKQGPKNILNLLSIAFDQDYGVGLESLLARWDNRFEKIEVKADQAQVKADQAQVKADQAQVKADQAHVKADQANIKLEAVYASTSWRVTTPLRWVSTQSRLLRERGIKTRFKDLTKKNLRFAMRFVVSKPKLNRFVFAVAQKIGCASFLKKMQGNFLDLSSQAKYELVQGQAVNLVQMSARARRVKQDIKTTLGTQNKQ